MILVTGAGGLIGREICARLTAAGDTVRPFDIARDAAEDTRDPAAVASALDGVEGIVHLAAVSRVVWAERDPAVTWATNVDAFASLIGLAADLSRRPWIVFASSREVYGEPAGLPVAESAPLKPMNVYARSKVAGETLAADAAARGLIANVARFSNVYGRTSDHPDRVVPAFARAAATGAAVRLEGPEHMFDFTHVADVARGLHRLIDATRAGQQLAPVHFVTGRGTTLRELSDLAVAFSGGATTREIHAPRNYDVARFAGDPKRARDVLGWSAATGIAEGFAQLADDFRAAAGGAPTSAAEPAAA